MVCNSFGSLRQGSCRSTYQLSAVHGSHRYRRQTGEQVDGHLCPEISSHGCACNEPCGASSRWHGRRVGEKFISHAVCICSFHGQAKPDGTRGKEEREGVHAANPTDCAAAWERHVGVLRRSASREAEQLGGDDHIHPYRRREAESGVKRLPLAHEGPSKVATFHVREETGHATA